MVGVTLGGLHGCEPPSGVFGKGFQVAILTVNTINRSGRVSSGVAAAAGGDLLPNTGAEFVMVYNGDASGKTVTFAIQRLFDGQTVPNKEVTVAASARVLIGPFPPGIYSNNDNRVAITYSDVTSVTIEALKLTTS